MDRILARLSALVLALGLTLPAGLAAADPSLLVSPTRVVFDSNKRTAVITLLNNGTDPGTYRLFLVHYRMTENGGFEEVKDLSKEDQQIDEMVRFTPKQVVLPPRQAQVVRVQLRFPENMPDGEYRTHLLFRVLPTVPAAGANGKANGISIKLIPAVGVSIPLIVRKGQTSAKAELGGLAVLPPSGQDDGTGGKARLGVELRRSGNQSIYGNLVARFEPKGGAEREVGRANGVAVYTPNAVRKAVLPLNAPFGELKHGVLHVSYDDPEPGNRPLATADLTLP